MICSNVINTTIGNMSVANSIYTYQNNKKKVNIHGLTFTSNDAAQQKKQIAKRTLSTQSTNLCIFGDKMFN